MKWIVDSRNPEVPRGLVETPAEGDTQVYPLGTLFTRKGIAIIPSIVRGYRHPNADGKLQDYDITLYEVN